MKAFFIGLLKQVAQVVVEYTILAVDKFLRARLVAVLAL